ncbi:MAG: 5-(carboxyamino)imidazole ribonucleotide mutase [bacterium]|nr:5-(carboxyamino)imidazole ribonucleotide mutase [bacterium]
MAKQLVSILMGSDSDLKVMGNAAKKLEELGVEYTINVCSAHRTLEKTLNIVDKAIQDGTEVFIVAAGMAAHLAGVVAGHSITPVIGVPMPGGALNGVDALYSTVQMPSGVPVGTVAIGKAGAINSAIFAAQILSVKYPDLKDKIKELKQKMRDEVCAKDDRLQELGYDKY